MTPSPAELLHLAGSVILCGGCDAPVTTLCTVRRDWPALTRHRCTPDFIPEG